MSTLRGKFVNPQRSKSEVQVAGETANILRQWIFHMKEGEVLTITRLPFEPGKDIFTAEKETPND